MSKSNKYPIDHTLISPNAIKVVTKLQQKGYEAYLVGGCIRDILLNKSPKDFDVVTSAHPEQVKHVFRNCRLIGRRFRLAHILFGREIIEVATFRSNANHKNKAKSDEGRVLQDNQYGTSLKDDAIRRDFTINALCYDPVKKKIFDFTSGLKDIDKGQIKILGKPEERYKEDPVRMLRAIRFKAKLGFKIEKHTFNAIDECRDTLYSVPPARLFDESLKMFQTGHALESFNELNNHDMLGYFYPIYEGNYDVQDELVLQCLANTDARIKKGMSVNSAFLIAVFLWHSVQKNTAKILKKGKTPPTVATQQAATMILAKQCQQLAIPRRLTNVMRDIWGLQYRLENYQGKKAKHLLEHPRFRAGYDFLCLRSQVGEISDAKCLWWTDYQKQHPVERKPYYKKHY